MMSEMKKPQSLDPESRIDVARALMEKRAWKEALAAFMELKDEGYRGVSSNIAWIYNNQEKRDIEKAMEYYRIGANEGDSYSQYALGGLYREVGDVDEAIKYYKMAAESGRDECLFLIHRLYEKAGNENESKKFLQQSVHAGDPFAIRNLAFDYMKGKYGLSNIFRGVILYFRNAKSVIAAAKKQSK